MQEHVRTLDNVGFELAIAYEFRLFLASGGLEMNDTFFYVGALLQPRILKVKVLEG
jgi:hypothetical protein